jgi:yeast amino acid transporter
MAMATEPSGTVSTSHTTHPNSTLTARPGFKGFCSVFVVAAFSFAGTELVGLAAAEAEDPRKSLPKATRQVFWRICGFYIVSLLIVGIIVPNNSDDLRGSSGANTKASPFVLAIRYAGVDGLPSVFNVSPHALQPSMPYLHPFPAHHHSHR